MEMRFCDNRKKLAHVCTRRGLKGGSSLKPRKMQVKCYRSVRYSPGVSNLPTGGRARVSVRPSPRTLRMGVADRRGAGWKDPDGPGPGKPAEESRCHLWIRKRDAERRGPRRPAGRWRPSARMAQPLSFGSELEIVRGRRRRQAVLEASASSRFRGKRGRELIVLCVQSAGGGRRSVPTAK